MNNTDIRTLFESTYDRDQWLVFLRDNFKNGLLLNANPREVNKEINGQAYTYYDLGRYEVGKQGEIGIFEYNISAAESIRLTKNRVGLRNLTKHITEQLAGAMVVFIQGDKWRFSYVSKRTVRSKDKTKLEKKETAPKRFTYLFGIGEKAKTASIQFQKLIDKQEGNLFQYLNLDDFEQAFSVEKLSKEFFADYKAIYEDLVEYITGKKYIKKSGKWVEQLSHDPNHQHRIFFNSIDREARDFVKRMLGRIVFLYFIQKKGWLAATTKEFRDGDLDYLANLFANSKNQEDFYASELVPLFFKTLNNPDSQIKPNKDGLFFPYLNGGLFDDSQDAKYNQLILPQDKFEKLFKTFGEFNFTVYEDAPDEQTVAVDPEMLGHIFENLLEDNKEKGAFYTPKEIVHYMCRESLLNYIYSYTGYEDDEAYKLRLQTYFDELDTSIFSSSELKQLDRALEDVKICDPAIGSGAFPMGLLHEIYNLKLPIEDKYGNRAKSPAAIKKHIIEESIYGVDIDPGAVDIARLRFWLSLVVDEDIPQPLPNLDFKIICANTLIPLGDFQAQTELAFGIEKDGELDSIHSIAKKLTDIREKFFDSSQLNKEKIIKEFLKVQTGITKLIPNAGPNIDFLTKLYDFDPFSHKSHSWFDPWWMFGIKDGFDIVIGNPPYVQMQKESGKLSELLKFEGYKTYERTGDLYAIFYELGFKILKQNGIHCFITSSQWMKANYGKSLRKLFLTKNPLKLIALGPSAFENAVVDTNILIAQNSDNLNKLLGAVILNKEETENLNTLVFIPMSYVNEDAWTIIGVTAQEIKRIIQEKGKPLSDWEVKINFGIKTGFNEAFIIDEEKKKELIKQDAKTEEIIKPILRGREVEKYYTEWDGGYLINTHNGVKNRNIKGIDVSQYLVIKKHLDLYQEQLISRADQGNTFYNLRNCAYLDEFKKEKIIWKRIGSKLRFSYSDKEMYCLDSTCIATGEKIKYLTALLNSKLCQYQLFETAPKTGMGDLIISVQALEPLIVYYPNVEEQKQFETLVDYLIYLHNKETTHILSHTDNTRIASHFEDILNMMVYELYFEEHMKEVGLDVLSYIEKELEKLEQLENQNLDFKIKHFYEWYQTSENPVRQRIMLIDTRSPDILNVIHKSS